MKIIHTLKHTIKHTGFAIAAGLFFHSGANAAKVIHDFNAGSMFCVVSSIQQPDAENLANQYFAGIQPIIQSEGVQFLVTFDVQEQLAGDHAAPFFSLITMPSLQTKHNINDKRLSEWQSIRELRPDVWSELRLRDYELSENLQLTLDSNKYYQLESFWVQTDKDDEFSDYRHSAEKSAKKHGGRVIYSAGVPATYETLGAERAPDHLVMSEWNSKAEFDAYWRKESKQPFSYLAAYNAWLMTLASR